MQGCLVEGGGARSERPVFAWKTASQLMFAGAFPPVVPPAPSQPFGNQTHFAQPSFSPPAPARVTRDLLLSKAQSPPLPSALLNIYNAQDLNPGVCNGKGDDIRGGFLPFIFPAMQRAVLCANEPSAA